MRVVSHCAVNRDLDSRAAAIKAAEAVRARAAGQSLAAAVVYATIDHDQETILAAVREVFGPLPIVGCSTGGLMGKDFFVEGGYALGLLGLGGSALHAATGVAEEYQKDSAAKARALGQKLRSELDVPPKVVILFADPLCGADMETFARSLQEEAGCPIIGGGAGQSWGLMVQTYQYLGTRAISHGATAIALGGDFITEIATSTGTEPTVLSAVVTRAEGNVLLELDGRPALDRYSEFLGPTRLTELTNDTSSAIALGIELPRTGLIADALSPYVVRGPFVIDPQRGALILGATIPTGTRIVFHRRSIPAVMKGAEATAQALRQRLSGRTVRAVLGFECGARTGPLLGHAEALREQRLVQQILAPDAAWLGMLAWGELAPYDGRATYYNYTLPLLVLAE
jgi:hypothetical protein